jgi:hypothetical protein
MSARQGLCIASALLLLYSPCEGSGRTDRNPTTHLEISDGLRDGATVYFLVDHVLALPGRLIVPMYAATPPKVLAEGLWLYCYDESTGAVRQIVRLSTSSSGGRRGNVRYTRLARDGTRIVMRYETGWSKDRKEVSHSVAVFSSLPTFRFHTTSRSRSSLGWPGRIS